MTESYSGVEGFRVLAALGVRVLMEEGWLLAMFLSIFLVGVGV